MRELTWMKRKAKHDPSFNKEKEKTCEKVCEEKLKLRNCMQYKLIKEALSLVKMLSEAVSNRGRSMMSTKGWMMEENG